MDISNISINENVEKQETSEKEETQETQTIQYSPKEETTNRFMNLNSLTIEYFSNTGLYNKYVNKVDADKFINNSDKKFYRKRIINETKKMLKDEFDSNELREIFNKYIFSLINHFKIIDTNDILQKQFLEDNSQNIINDISNIYISGLDISNNIEMIDEINIYDVSNCSPDELLFKKKECKILTMDNFINVKQRKRETINLPLKKNINLREPELKMKGIQKKIKKENIDNL